MQAYGLILACITVVGLLAVRALALALILPVELPCWGAIQSIACGVVMFNLLVTAPLTPYI